MSELKRKVRIINLQSFIFVLIIFFSSAIFTPDYMIFILFPSVIFSWIYLLTKTGNIKCPNCYKPYGITVSLGGNTEIPPKCMFCRTEAT